MNSIRFITQVGLPTTIRLLQQLINHLNYLPAVLSVQELMYNKTVDTDRTHMVIWERIRLKIMPDISACSRYSVNRLLANAGIRYTYNTYFGDIAVPQAGITYKLTEETNIRASVGRGYRAPQIFEIYQLTPRDGTLQPENLWNYEIGISHVFSHYASIDIAGYLIDAQNTIVDSWYRMKSWNTGGFHRDGVECSAQFLPFDNFTINANYSFTDKPDVAQAVPKHKAYLGGEYRWNVLTFLLSAQYVNTIYGTDETDYTLKRLPDYTNMEIRVAAQVTEKISLSIGSRNVLNESYQTIYGYPMPGRTVNVGMRASL